MTYVFHDILHVTKYSISHFCFKSLATYEWRSARTFLSAQHYTLKHYPSLFCLALVPIQDPQIVDGVEGRGVVRTRQQPMSGALSGLGLSLFVSGNGAPSHQAAWSVQVGGGEEMGIVSTPYRQKGAMPL
jgi:hypothetical protein